MSKARLTEKKGPRHRRGKRRKNGNNTFAKKARSTIGYLRGLANEELVFDSLNGKFKNKPYWFCGWKKADGTEDHERGTDYFIHTYLCDVRVDIKSSDLFAEKAKRRIQKVRMIDTVVVVVKSHMTLGDVRQRIFAEVEEYLNFRFTRAMQILKATHHNR